MCEELPRKNFLDIAFIRSSVGVFVHVLRTRNCRQFTEIAQTFGAVYCCWGQSVLFSILMLQKFRLYSTWYVCLQTTSWVLRIHTLESCWMRFRPCGRTATGMSAASCTGCLSQTTTAALTRLVVQYSSAFFCGIPSWYLDPRTANLEVIEDNV